LHALGHEISLNHAYEAVAAMSGYPTWSVMKAKLEETTALPPTTVKPFPIGKIPWHKFTPGEHNPTSLFFGPDGDRRSAIMEEMGREFFAGFHEHSPFLRAIAFSTGADRIPELEGIEADFCRARISREDCDLSIFDLPLGRRYPCQAHRQRIIDFLTDLVATLAGKVDLSPADIRALAEPVPRMVDKAYANCDRNPKAYRPEVFEEIDKELDLEVSGRKDLLASWWETSDLLAWRSRPTWAQWAQAQAVPALVDFMGIAREADMGGVISSGERAADVIVRCISAAVREYGFLRKPYRRPGRRHARAAVIDIVETPLDPRADNLLFRIAENDYRMLVDDIDAHESTRALYEERMPTAASSMRLLVSANGPQYAIMGQLSGLLGDAIADGRELVIFTDDVRCASTLRDMSSSYFVHGCHDHADVARVARALGLDGDHVNVIHDHMVGDMPRGLSGIPLVACRRKFHLTETSAVILPS
jgi:hypothetical protein